MFNLRRDPFERAQHNSNSYYEFVFDHVFLIYGMMGLVQAADRRLRQIPAAAIADLIQP